MSKTISYATAGWETARAEFRDGSKRAGLKALFTGLKTGLDPVARLKEAQRVLDDHKHNVYLSLIHI